MVVVIEKPIALVITLTKTHTKSVISLIYDVIIRFRIES